MADQTKRVTLELDASALPNLKQSFSAVEKGAQGMERAVGKARGNMISDLRQADRGVQSLSHSMFMLGSVAGGMDQKFAQAFSAFGMVHAGIQGVRGLAMEMKVLGGAMGARGGIGAAGAAAGGMASYAMPAAAVAAIAAAAMAVLASHDLQNWLGNKIVELERPGSKNAALRHDAWTSFGQPARSDEEKAEIRRKRRADPTQQTWWQRFSSGFPWGGRDITPEERKRMAEMPHETSERKRQDSFKAEQRAMGKIGEQAPILQRERDLLQHRAEMLAQASFGGQIPGAARGFAGPMAGRLQGILGLQAQFPKLMEHGQDIALQTQMEHATEMARGMGQQRAEAQAEFRSAGFAALRSGMRSKSAHAELEAWRMRIRPQGARPDEATEAEGRRLAENTTREDTAHQANLERFIESKKKLLGLSVQELQQEKEIANQVMLKGRAERAQAEAKLLSFKERWGGMDPSSRKAAITVMEEARRNIAALEAGAKLPQGQQRQWRMIAGKMQLDPAMPGMMSQDKMAHLERTDPGLAAQYKRAIAEADPEFKRAAALTEAEEQRKAGLGLEKAGEGRKAEAQKAIEMKLDETARVIANDIMKVVTGLIDQQLAKIKVALDAIIAKQENEKQAAARQLAP